MASWSLQVFRAEVNNVSKLLWQYGQADGLLRLVIQLQCLERRWLLGTVWPSAFLLAAGLDSSISKGYKIGMECWTLTARYAEAPMTMMQVEKLSGEHQETFCLAMVSSKLDFSVLRRIGASTRRRDGGNSICVSQCLPGCFQFSGIWTEIHQTNSTGFYVRLQITLGSDLAQSRLDQRICQEIS